MKLRLLALALPFALVACGGDDDDGGVPIDAASLDGEVDGPTDALPADAVFDTLPPIDAPPSSVQVIPNCTGIPQGTEDHVITVAAGDYSPDSSTITVNDVVRFEPAGFHDIDATNGEFGTVAGELACLRFTAAGTFPIHCTIHGFSGSVTVN